MNAHIEQGKFNILVNGKLFDEIKTLKNKTNIALSELCPLEFMHPGYFNSVKPVSSLGWSVKQTRILSKVVLPHPEGPITATNSPSSTAMLILLRATVSISSESKTFVNSSVLTID
jgi:hypothetical protein